MADKIGTTATGAELWDGVPAFLPQEWGNLSWIEDQEVIEGAQAHDLMLEESDFTVVVNGTHERFRTLRVWWSRVGTENGDPFKETIEVEVLTMDRKWLDRWCFPAE